MMWMCVTRVCHAACAEHAALFRLSAHQLHQHIGAMLCSVASVSQGLGSGTYRHDVQSVHV